MPFALQVSSGQEHGTGRICTVRYFVAGRHWEVIEQLRRGDSNTKTFVLGVTSGIQIKRRVVFTEEILFVTLEQLLSCRGADEISMPIDECRMCSRVHQEAAPTPGLAPLPGIWCCSERRRAAG